MKLFHKWLPMGQALLNCRSIYGKPIPHLYGWQIRSKRRKRRFLLIFRSWIFPSANNLVRLLLKMKVIKGNSNTPGLKEDLQCPCCEHGCEDMIPLAMSQWSWCLWRGTHMAPTSTIHWLLRCPALLCSSRKFLARLHKQHTLNRNLWDVKLQTQLSLYFHFSGSSFDLILAFVHFCPCSALAQALYFILL